jgi:hypothetical protein
VGETGRKKGVKSIFFQVLRNFKRFCGTFDGFGAGAQELFWKTNAKKGLFFSINRRFWDCFWGG